MADIVHLPLLLPLVAITMTLAGTLYVTRVEGAGTGAVLPPLCGRLKPLLSPLLVLPLTTGDGRSAGMLATPVRC